MTVSNILSMLCCERPIIYVDHLPLGLSILKKKLLGVGVDMNYDLTGNLAGEAVTSREIEEQLRQQEISEQEAEDAKKGIINPGKDKDAVPLPIQRTTNSKLIPPRTTPEQVAQQLGRYIK